MIPDAAVEAAAKAIALRDHNDTAAWAAYKGDAEAAINAAAPHLLGPVRAEADRLRAHILDIDAHATPFGDIPDDPGYVGVYLVTAGSLHRALGTIGHTSPSCEAEAELRKLRTTL